VAGGYAVKMSMDFDTSLRKIIGLVGISAKTVFGWKKDMRDLSRETGVDLDQIAEGMFFVTSAGFRGDAAMRVLRASTRAAAAGLGDVHTVADATTSAVNAYGEANLSATAATDALVAGVREGKMPVDALGGAIGQVLGVASEVGVSFQEVVATAAALSRVGAPVNRTMTGIRFLLTNLVNPTAKAQKALKSVHLTADDLRDSIKKKGLLATLQDLRARFGENLGGFLNVVGGARGVVVALGLVGKHAKTVNGILDRTQHSAGSTGRAFDAMAKGPGFRFHKAMNSLKVSLEELGDTITPLVLVLAGGIAKIAEGFTSLGSAGKYVLGVLVLLGPVLKLVGFGFRIMAASAVMAEEGTLAAAVGAEGLSAALLALPITWIVLGLVAIGVGLFILYKKVHAFRAAVQATFAWIRSHWKLLAVLIGGPLGFELVKVVEHFKTIKRWAEAVWNIAKKIVRTIAKIKFPHVPGSGIIGKAVHGGGGLLNSIEGALAGGGDVANSGRYLVGEKGPEVVSLPKGAHVTPNDGLGGELVTVPVVLTMDGRVVAEQTARVTADRRARR
jgi:TP901 family phage tail tape measure protein